MATITIRELALKSVELSADVDGDDPNNIADTVLCHWRRGAWHFGLPTLAFSEDPEDEDVARECGIELAPMPEAVGAALRNHFKGDFHAAGRQLDWNPEVEWEGRQWVLIDLVPLAVQDGGVVRDVVLWAIFVPADAINI